jgi:hypothetical protein
MPSFGRSPLWRNQAFVRVWTAATISVLVAAAILWASPTRRLLVLRVTPDREG